MGEDRGTDQRGALESLPTSIVERMNMHRLSASIHDRAIRFRDGSRIARCCWVSLVAVQRGLQGNGGLRYLRSSGAAALVGRVGVSVPPQYCGCYASVT